MIADVTQKGATLDDVNSESVRINGCLWMKLQAAVSKANN